MTEIKEKTKRRLDLLLDDNDIDKSVYQSVKERNIQLFDRSLKKSIIKDPEGIISTYIEEMYNPTTSKLDDNNLLLNLIILDLLLDFNIIDFNFDTNYKKYSTSEHYLEMERYTKILNEPIEDGAKYVQILENSFKLSFYKTLFETIIKSADNLSYNKTNIKMKNVWKFLDDDTDNTSDLIAEDYLIEFIDTKTIKGSIIMVTPDMTPQFKLNESSKETYDESDEPYVKYIGIWNEKFIYEINTKKIDYMKGFKQGVFFIKEGNSYNINPEKPLLYYNIIDNMFLAKPVLKLFASIDLDFHNSSTTFLKIDI